MTEPTYPGGCLCGAVRYLARGEPLNVRICHCEMCRKVTGGAVFARAIFRADQVEVEGQARDYASSPDLVRGFCAICGSSLFARRKSRPDFLGVTLGTLDDPSALKPQAHIFTASQIDWLAFDDDLPKWPAFPPA